MPLPTPADEEDEKGFISRCMSNEHMKEKFPDQKQRVAVCYKQFGVAKGEERVKETRIPIAKFDEYKQIVYGEVYVPDVPDSQGDYMSATEIERVAHGFLKKGAVENIDTEHNLKRSGAVVVESFIARKGDPDFIPGSWVVGVHIPDRDEWQKVLKGDISGFSMYGTGRRVQRTVEIEVPDDGMIFGKTALTSGPTQHNHVYMIKFDDEGNFLGGETNEVDGHRHKIDRGTVTKSAGTPEHGHRFTLLDSLMKSEEIDYSDDEIDWIVAMKEQHK